MSDSSKKPTSSPKTRLSPQKYARLKEEAKYPYRGLRKFFYVAFGASGLIGAVVFLARLAAGRDIPTNLSNLVLQIGLIALTVFLFRWELQKERQ